MNQDNLLLAVDVGNTNTKICLFEGDQIVDKSSVATGPLMVGNLKSFIQKYQSRQLYISSVVPEWDCDLQDMAGHLDLNPVFIDHRITTAIRIKIDRPEELGADRIVNANAGLSYFKPPFMVIDSGTATTFDLVDKNYNYIGGVIFPGIDIALKSLSENTAKLKEIDFFKPDSPIGKNSADCIRAGLYYGYIGSLNYIIKLYKELLGSETRVIVTGGLIGFLKDQLEGVDIYKDDLIFQGIYSIYKHLENN